MSLEQSILIDKYERLFAEEGWKELVSDLNEKRGQLASNLLNSASKIEEVFFQRGLAAGYQYVLGLEGTVERIKQQSLPDVLDA